MANDSEYEVRDLLMAALALLAEEGFEKSVEVRTFEAEGLMTMETGLVLQMEDGSEYQVEVKQAKNAF